MPNQLRLSMTFREYERTRALTRGQVTFEGIDPIFVPFELDHFRRMLNNEEFDVCELSMSSYLTARERGVPIVALPVFPHRRFRHSFVFVRADPAIKDPRELKGARVGIPVYAMTALVWIRAFMQHDYDVRPEEIRWYFDQDVERMPIRLPAGLSLEPIPPRSKERLFLEGKLEALVDAKVPEIYLQGNPSIRRLFEDYRRVELDYFKRTGLFPIMHTIVVKEAVLHQHPWVAMNVWKAFVSAKEASYRRSSDPRISNLVWPNYYLDEEAAVFGRDPWPYTVKENRKTLEALIQYAHEQGLISKEPRVEEIFAPTTLDLRESQHVPYDV